MFTPGRYIVVDDQIEDLMPLVEALNRIGAPCLGIHYDVATPVEPKFFAGVRILFFDLHLVPAQGTSPHARYAHIIQILTDCINPSGGPYIMVLWTSHLEERDAFADYVAKVAGFTDRRPLAILGLNKNDYRDANGSFAGAQLRADIEKTIASHAQLQVLLAWEANVLAAAGATLATLGELVPQNEQSIEKYPQAIDGILSRLAGAAVGIPNASKDPRGAINSALAPILLDRILNQRASAEINDLWSKAITRYNDLPEMDVQQAGRMNRMLHLAMPQAELIRPTDWGAIVKIPDGELVDDAMQRRFGSRAKDILSQIFQIEKKDRERCQLCLLRVGAVCDFAQNRVGPIPYVLCLVVPVTVQRRDAARPLAEMETPAFELARGEESVRFLVNARFQVSLVQENIEGWTALCRIREQLLTMVVAHISAYVMRPGIVKLPQ